MEINSIEELKSLIREIVREELDINNCKFEKIKLESGEVGLVPLKCKEFNNDIVNVYKGIKYRWVKIQKDYGTVLLAML